MGESTQDLNKLFHWPENDEAAIKNNISAIGDLYQKKVLPYFEQFNDYSLASSLINLLLTGSG